MNPVILPIPSCPYGPRLNLASSGLAPPTAPSLPARCGRRLWSDRGQLGRVAVEVLRCENLTVLDGHDLDESLDDLLPTRQHPPREFALAEVVVLAHQI